MKPRILVVDDQQEWTEFLREELRTFDLEIAESSDAALRELQQDDFDLIVANIRRIDVLQTIADKYPDKHVVVMTITPTVREAAMAYLLGALDYFPRSFDAQFILTTIEKALRIAQKRRDSFGSQQPGKDREA